MLSILLVIGCFGTVLFRYSRGSVREVDALAGHLRALAVADAAYAEVVSHLSKTGWDARWFKAGPELRSDVSAVGGTYDALLRDAPGNVELPTLPVLISDLPPGQAELMVRARWKSHTTVCVWRLTVPRDGFAELAKIVPAYFGNLPEGTQVAPGSLSGISAQIDEMAKRRERNRATFEGMRPGLENATTPGAIGTAMGFGVPGGVVDVLPGAEPGTTRPLGPYTEAVKSGLPRPPLIPAGGSWADEPWRKWRLGGADGKGTRAGIADRSARGTDDEASAWSDWPGWRAPAGGGTPFVAAPNWDAWRRWGIGESDNHGGWESGQWDDGGARGWWYPGRGQGRNGRDGEGNGRGGEGNGRGNGFSPGRGGSGRGGGRG